MADSHNKTCLTVEIILTKIAVGITLLVSFLLGREVIDILITRIYERNYWRAGEEFLFLAIVIFFVYGNLVYQFTRVGYLKRLSAHQPASLEDLESIYDKSAPALTILVPSYKEDERIIKETLLSAALQEYPNRRVVLLIDDSPTPGNSDDLSVLLAARRLPHEVQKLFEKPKIKLQGELADFVERKSDGLNISKEYLRLAGLCREIAKWFEDQASNFCISDHTDKWFVKKILLEPAGKYLRRAEELLQLFKRGDWRLNENMILREYRKLASLFDVELTSFERKRYDNLSHEANKAMNLNSYIGLIGKSLREVTGNRRVYLEEAEPGSADIFIPDTEYLITLDADSLLLSDYAMRLVHVMEQPGNEGFGVIQTPYNAIPGAPGVLERIAGATTDIQYIIHQGFTYYGATFWVGANALLRKAALEDICMIVKERGFDVRRYIQDRTVIEDTESSVDLIDRGWKLFNYPDRLSYSATPPDFGSLLIQRRRWANGGLIILPKLLRYLFRDRNVHQRIGEGLNRVHYLSSIAGVNAGLVLIMLYPFEPGLRSIVCLALLFCINSFIYGRDLVQSGYRLTDLLRVYALNLMLIPINLGGVIKSIHQAWTCQKIPFGRTPKVTGRTSAPALYIIAEFVILFFSMISFFAYFILGKWLYALLSFSNAVFFLYIVKNYMGLTESKEDLLNWWPASSMKQALSNAATLQAGFAIALLLMMLLIIQVGMTNAY